MRDNPDLTPELLLEGYAAGIFPMAEGRDDPEIHWIEPRERGVLPLGGFHLSRSLRRRLRNWPHRATLDADFEGVLDACAAREQTWINAPLRELYLMLHGSGDAHSVEIWHDGALAGGVYGVTLGGAFFGESMFSHRSDASKMALAYLVDLLRRGGFVLFDTQFLTPHLVSLGGVELPRQDYRAELSAALALDAELPHDLPGPAHLLQRMTQMS